MTQTGKGLVAFALIFGLIGTGLGGFMLVKNYGLVDEINELNNRIEESNNRIEELEKEEDPYVVPRARVYRLGSYSLVSGDTTKFDYTNTSYDTHSAFNLTLDEYTIPETGFYQVIAQFCITAEDQDFFKINININGSMIASRSYTASRSTNTFAVSITDIVNTTAGDIITITAYSYNAGGFSRLVYSSEVYSFFTISKLF